ncbi:hypothetical protein F5878DRAFT_663480 [Lentinula raphanica]|uniref:BZIP domain-containing protein n=1 Tax=Lentinula raphanica TaxID=153919 RepID=A0AA38P3X5_9AGAR|nr:hypothetical protein F5880DRAFT_1509722 [Lentinula raphanica]KAJ3835868.1 hypothetical protein F5878DRAFT_663480 [Lentinula raphanica]
MTRFALPIAIIIALLCGSVHFPTLAAPVAVSPLPSDPALESEVAVPSCVPPLGQGLQPVGGVQRSTFNAREPAAATNTVELNDKRNPHTTEVNFASLGTDGGVGTHNDGRGLSIFTLEPQMNAQAALERRELRRQKLRRRNLEQQKLIQQNTADAQIYEDRAKLMKRLVDALEECINILEQHTLDNIEFLSFVENTSRIKFEADHLRAEFQQRVASFTRHPPRSTDRAQEDSHSCDNFSLHVSQKLEKAANSLYEWHAFEAGEPSSYVNHNSENSMNFEVEVDQLKYWISDFESRAKYSKDHVSEEIVHYRPVSEDVSDHGLNQHTR